MREGKPSTRFGARGLHNIHLGGGDTPLLLKLYDKHDNVIATLTEEKGECIDPGYVDFSSAQTAVLRNICDTW
jgi:hypothetical protein